jgi:hypothetical protein
MYRVDGSSDLDEETLDHFEGYRGSSPVRIGNGAADQLQLDIYGEAMDSILFTDRAGLVVGDRGWNDIARMIDWLCEHWDQPDEDLGDPRRSQVIHTARRSSVPGPVRSRSPTVGRRTSSAGGRGATTSTMGPDEGLERLHEALCSSRATCSTLVAACCSSVSCRRSTKPAVDADGDGAVFVRTVSSTATTEGFT